MTILFSGTITNLGPLPAGPGGELAIFNNDGSVVSNFQFLLPFNFIVGPGETTAVIPFFSFTVVANPTLGPFVIRYSIRESNALVFTANIQDLPEPSTMLLLGAGLAGLILRKKHISRLSLPRTPFVQHVNAKAQCTRAVFLVITTGWRNLRSEPA